MQTVANESTMSKIGDVIRDAIDVIHDVLTDHPFFDWRWAITDVVVVGIWMFS